MPNIGLLIERRCVKFLDKMLDRECLSYLLSHQYANESGTTAAGTTRHT